MEPINAPTAALNLETCMWTRLLFRYNANTICFALQTWAACTTLKTNGKGSTVVCGIHLEVHSTPHAAVSADL